MAELLSRLRIPVVAAPMFLISSPELVIAACNSGVIGSFPTPNCRTVEDLNDWMSRIHHGVSNTDSAPWAVNLITHSSNKRLEADLELVAKYKPEIVITALGSPAPVMDTVKSYGGKVIADVISINLARKAVAAGVDGLACISAGAGGHTGHLSPFAFTAAVREFFDGIITIGGGVASGSGIAGAIAAGADLVYIGTRFLVSEESLAPVEYKQMVIDHGPDDLVVTDRVTGSNASWLKPSLLANGIDLSAAATPTERNYDATDGGSGKRWKDIWAAGQGLQLIRSIEPTATIVDHLDEEYKAATSRFLSLAGVQAL